MLKMVVPQRISRLFAAYFTLWHAAKSGNNRAKNADSPLLFLPEHMEEPEIIAFSRT
jgi:hypothetical protein